MPKYAEIAAMPMRQHSDNAAMRPSDSGAAAPSRARPGGPGGRDPEGPEESDAAARLKELQESNDILLAVYM